MLMTAVTAVFLVIICSMAGFAIGIVVVVEQEIGRMVEVCGFPVFRGMALAAVCGDGLMQGIGRLDMTGLAVGHICIGNHIMVEGGSGFPGICPFVVAVAGEAIGIFEFTVKQGIFLVFCSLVAVQGVHPNFVGLMAADTLFGIDTPEGCMAGKAIVLEILVAGNQLAGVKHQVRVLKRGCHNSQNYQGDQDLLHRLNITMVMIWMSESTISSKVMGIWTLRQVRMMSTVMESKKSFFSASSGAVPESIKA